MTESDVASLTRLVLWCAFGLAVVFGAVAQRTHFCTMGALADVFSMRDFTRLRMWALAVAVAAAGFNAMVGLGWVQASSSVYAGERVLWLSSLVGGLMFGFGMVLSSGCGSKSLVRVGGGNLKSLVVVLVLGVAAFATLKGLTAVWRVATVEQVFFTLRGGQDLPTLLGGAVGRSPASVAPWVGAAVALLLLGWVLRRRDGRSAEVWLGGVGIGAAVVGFWWLSGRLGHLAEDPRTLEEVFLATSSRRMEAINLVSPVAYALDWLMFFSDSSKVLTIGIVSVAGIVVGSAVVALAQRTFRWEGFGGVEDTANHLLGAVLMGVGGVVALGCTVGQGISGVSTLSVGSFIALAAICGGGFLGLRWQSWRLERML